LFLTGGSCVRRDNIGKFLAVGVLALLLDAAVCRALFTSGVDAVIAHAAAWGVVSLVCGVLMLRWVFRPSVIVRLESPWWRAVRMVVIALFAMGMRGAVFAACSQAAGWSEAAALAAAILTSAAVHLIGAALFLLPAETSDVSRAIWWRSFALAMVAYSVVMRLLFAGAVDLMPQEAYYWLYAQHIDIGYLDHPPMVAWMIWLSTAVLGESELAVRLPACLTWMVTATFVFLFARNLFGRTVAWRTVLLLAVLPAYFGVGFLMTPDAPLYACWAGCLFFLERALVAERRGAWLGVGVCLGLGMLSKYTIALLGPAIILFVLTDRRSRRWLLRPEPYLAILCSLAIFSPVIIWNAMNDWASFAFQGPRRLKGGGEFGLFDLIGNATVLLTPVGFFGVLIAMLPARWGGTSFVGGDSRRRPAHGLDPADNHQNSLVDRRQESPPTEANRQRRFSLIFTLAPLAVFVIQSLQNPTKFNWTGPVWLAALPLMAVDMTAAAGEVRGRMKKLGRALWKPTLLAVPVFYGAAMFVIATGMTRSSKMSLPVAWQELGREVEMIEQQIADETGEKPIVIGLNDYHISSELFFYDTPGETRRPRVGSQSLFGRPAVMWKHWYPPEQAEGRNVMLIDVDQRDMSLPEVVERFDHLSEVREQEVRKDGRVVGRFYYRVGYKYRGRVEAPDESLRR
jgi:dolichol-phosphate mannosyltransferase